MYKKIAAFFTASLLCVSVALADGTGSTNTGEPTKQFDGKSWGEILRILASTPDADRTFPPICDSLGFVWFLTKTGNSITGTADFGCGGIWPVTGSNVGPSVSLIADGTGINACYCNDAVDMSGTVNVGARTFSGTHTQLNGCPGQVPVTAGLCE